MEFIYLLQLIAGLMARLYVGKLPNSARERDLEKFFKGYGKIREVVLKAGYGFVVSSVSTNVFFITCYWINMQFNL